MFKKRLEYEILRYYSIIIFSFFLATPVFAQIENNQRNQSSPTITIENNPQNFQNPTPFPISSYIDEIDKKNQLLKKDLLLLRNQVNNLSKEIGTVKNSDNNGFIKDALEKQWSLVVILLAFLIIAACIAFYLIYSKLKKDNNQVIYMKIDELSEETKRNILKEFKIKEAEYQVNAQAISEIRQSEFENKLNDKYVDYIKEIAQNNESEINNFKISLEKNTKESYGVFENNLQTIFDKKNGELKEKLDQTFPTESTTTIFNKMIEDKGIVKSISENIENNVINSINDKIKQLEQNIYDKEKEILTEIQKTQLSNNHFNIANVYLKEGKLEDAIEEYHLSLRTDPNFYGAYINLGKAYEMIHNPDNAIDMYNQAISTRPEHYKAYFNLGNLLNSIGKYDDADFMYKKALEYSPDNHKVYNNLGISNQLMKKTESARNYYLKAISLNKDYPDAYINLAKLEAEMGNDRGLYQIAENYMKKNKASQETYYKVKELAYSTIS